MHELYLYILVMAGVTYLIRALPLTLIRREIRNPFLRSFIYYVPYATLAAMTFPAILGATGSLVSALAGLTAAVILAFFDRSLILVAAGAASPFMRLNWYYPFCTDLSLTFDPFYVTVYPDLNYIPIRSVKSVLRE